MSARAAAAALVCALMLTCCGLPDSEPTRLIPPDGTAGPLRGVKDDVVVFRAVRALVDADSGRFSSRLYISGEATEFVDARGAWRFSTAESELSLESVPQRGPASVYDYRVFRRGFYLRLTEGRDDGCWMPFGTPQIPPWTPAGHVTAPSQVHALLSARGARQRSPVGTARGTVALGDAIGILGPVWTQAVQRAGERAMSVRLAAVFSLDEGRFTGWRIEGRDVAASLIEGGIRLRRALRVQLAAYSVRVTLSRPGAAVDVAMPESTCSPAS